MYGMTPWVKRLLIANLVMFLVAGTSPGIYRDLAFQPWVPTAGGWVPGILIRPWTLVTYMFIHAGFQHIFFNMLGLWVFGPRLEQHLGGKDFLWLYFLAGLGGAALSFVFQPGAVVVGASGGVLGLVLAFAMFWPREKIFLFPIPIPVEVRILAGLYLAWTLWAGFAGMQQGVAHFAHLGGLVFAFAYIKLRAWRKGAAKREFQRKLEGTQGGGGGFVGDRIAVQRWQAIDVEHLHELNREEVIHLLDKVKTAGIKSLSQTERQFLDRMAASVGL